MNEGKEETIENQDGFSRPLLIFKVKKGFITGFSGDDNYEINLGNGGGYARIQGLEFLQDWDVKLEALLFAQLWSLEKQRVWLKWLGITVVVLLAGILVSVVWGLP